MKAIVDGIVVEDFEIDRGRVLVLHSNFACHKGQFKLNHQLDRTEEHSFVCSDNETHGFLLIDKIYLEPETYTYHFQSHLRMDDNRIESRKKRFRLLYEKALEQTGNKFIAQQLAENSITPED
jgi:hypothetical protein